jgi:hypothetical protein
MGEMQRVAIARAESIEALQDFFKIYQLQL